MTQNNRPTDLPVAGQHYDRHVLLVWCLGLLLALLGPAHAVDKTFTGTANGNNFWNTAGNWSPSGVPVTGDSVFITNNLGAGVTATSVLNTVDFTLTDFIATNTGVATRPIVVDNGRVLQVTGTSRIGSNTIFNLGSNSSGGSTFTNNHLFLLDNGVLAIRQSTLTVSGLFSNSAASTLTFDLAGGSRLLFTNPANIVTNRGTFSLLLPTTTGTGHNVLQVGNDTTANTFHNAGTLLAGMITQNYANRVFIFSNRFINAGTFILTNAGTGANSTISFTITGASGGAVTNLAGGLFRIISTGSGAGVRNVMTLNAGGFVNLGELSLEHTVADKSNILVLAEAATAFSNAPTGHLRSLGGLAFLQADRHVNTGTLSVEAGTLNLLTRTAGPGLLENAGTIFLNGGNLVAAGNLTNLPTGTLRATTGAGTLVHAVANAGTLSATGADLILAAGLLGATNTGTLHAGPAGNLYLGTTGGSTLFNLGTLRPDGGTLHFGPAINAGILTNFGTLGNQSAFSNLAAGLVVASGGTLRFTNETAPIRNLGTLAALADGTLTFGTPAGNTVLSNAGTIHLEGGRLLSGAITNHSGAVIRGAGTIAGAIVAQAGSTLEATNGLLTLHAGPTLAGNTILRHDGALKIGAAGNLTLANAGNLALFGGTLIAGDLTNNAGAILRKADANPAVISNRVVNLGLIQATNGLLQIGELVHAGLLNLGTATTGGILSNGNLLLVGTAALIFTNQSGSGVNTLIVAGQFTNTTSSSLRLDGSGGSARIVFTDPTRIATNAGTMLFTLNGSGATFTVQAGTDATPGTFHNAGTFAAHLLGGIAARTGTLSNLFVNSGLFLMTNQATSAGDRRLTVLVTGNITNELTGTINLVTTQNLTNVRAGNVITNTTGSFVNRGTLTSLVTSGAGDVLTNTIFLASGAFSNATHAQVITRAGSTGLLLIRADQLANLGTNLLQGGTLVYQGAPLQNAGILRFQGGHLEAALVTNLAGGLIFPVAGNATLQGAVINHGQLHATTGVFTVTGALSNRVAGLVELHGAGTLSGGLVHNAGLLNALAGGNLDAPLVNAASGWINATNGTLALGGPVGNDGVISNTTTITLAANLHNAGSLVLVASRLLGGTLTNTGLVAVSGASTLTALARNEVGGHIEIAGSLVISNAPGTTVTNAGLYTLNGTMLALTAGPLAGARSNNFYNAGTLQFLSGGATLGSFINVGTVVANQAVGGTLTILGAGNLFSNAPSGRILVNSGTVLVDGSLVNLGVIEATGHADAFGVRGAASFLTNAAGGVILNTNAAVTLRLRTQSGLFANRGSIVVSNGATLTLQTEGTAGQSWSNLVGGLVRLGNASSDGILNSGTLMNQGTIEASGTITLVGALPGGAGRPLFNEPTGTLRVLDGRTLSVSNIAGSIQNAQVVNAGSLIVGSGTATLRLISGFAGGITNLNAGTLQLHGGTLAYVSPTPGILSNTSSGWIQGGGVITNARVLNLGTILASGATPLDFADSQIVQMPGAFLGAHAGELIVRTALTNVHGATISFLNSVGTFHAPVVNAGAWLTDPTTNIFHSTFSVDTNGFVSATAGDVFHFRSHFLNQSTLSNSFNTTQATFIFDGSGGHTQAFYVAGLDLGGNPGVVLGTPSATNAFLLTSTHAYGFSSNFALGHLQIGNASTNSTLVLMDTWGTIGPDDSAKAGLYLETLTLVGNSILIISNNVEVYFRSTNNVHLTGLNQNVFLLGNAGFHQLLTVPEPNILMLLLAGGWLLNWARRRRSPQP